MPSEMFQAKHSGALKNTVSGAVLLDFISPLAAFWQYRSIQIYIYIYIYVCVCVCVCLFTERDALVGYQKLRFNLHRTWPRPSEHGLLRCFVGLEILQIADPEVNTRYLHKTIDTIPNTAILHALRLGIFPGHPLARPKTSC